METITKRELAHSLGKIKRIIRKPTILTNNGEPEIILLPLKRFVDHSYLWTEKKDPTPSEEEYLRRERQRK